MSTHKPVDWTKELRTKDGKKARLLGVLNTAAEYKYVVAVSAGDYEWVANYKESGTYAVFGCATHNDLINPPTRIKREVWANVYHDCVATHNTRQSADNCAAQSARLACVKITILCTEGEGL